MIQPSPAQHGISGSIYCRHLCRRRIGISVQKKKQIVSNTSMLKATAIKNRNVKDVPCTKTFVRKKEV